MFGTSHVFSRLPSVRRFTDFQPSREVDEVSRIPGCLQICHSLRRDLRMDSQQFLHDHGLETDVALKTFSGISRSGDRIRTTKDCIASAAARRFRQAGTRPFEETALDCRTISILGRESNDQNIYPPPRSEKYSTPGLGVDPDIDQRQIDSAATSALPRSFSAHRLWSRGHQVILADDVVLKIRRYDCVELLAEGREARRVGDRKRLDQLDKRTGGTLGVSTKVGQAERWY